MSSSSKKDEPFSKRIRLAAADALAQRGVHSGHIAHVLDSLGKHDCVDETLSTRQIRDQAHADSQAWIEKWGYEIQLPMEDGNTYAWSVSSPSAILQFVASAYHSFGSLMSLLPSGQEIPLALYHDEVQPGNILCPDQRRKTMAIYFSLLPWKALFASEYIWFPVATLRTEVYKSVQGGFSACIKMLIESWQSSLPGLVLHGKRYPLRIACVVADEAAIVAMWGFKGAAGRKPCGFCVSLISKATSASLRASGTETAFHGLSEPNIRAFTSFSDESFWKAVDHLSDFLGASTKKAFAEREKNLGITFNPHGLAAASSLRDMMFPSMTLFDVLHTYFNGGIVSVEVGLFLTHVEKVGIAKTDVAAALLAPSLSSLATGYKNRSRLLDDGYFTEGKCWRAAGSEQMDAMPLFHYWLEIELLPLHPDLRLSDWVKSFQQLCERCYCLHMLMRTEKNQFLKLLETKQRSHHACFTKAYGEAAMKPKHHFSLHIPVQFEKMQVCMDTKTCERKHRALKEEVESTMQNLRKFESRLIFKLLTTQVSEMNQKPTTFWQTCLVAPVFKNGFWSAQTLQLPGGFQHHKDMPLISSDLQWAGYLLDVIQEGTTIFLSLQMCQFEKRKTTGIYVWSVTSMTRKIPWQTNLCVTPRHWRRQLNSLWTIW